MVTMDRRKSDHVLFWYVTFCATRPNICLRRFLCRSLLQPLVNDLESHQCRVYITYLSTTKHFSQLEHVEIAVERSAIISAAEAVPSCYARAHDVLISCQNLAFCFLS
jgi:hypothetical protein